MPHFKKNRKVVYNPTLPRTNTMDNLKAWQAPQYGVNRYVVQPNPHGRFVNYVGKLCNRNVNMCPSYPIGLNDYQSAAQETNFSKIMVYNGGLYVINQNALKDVFKYAKKDTDFGAALYLNPYEDQATEWALKRATDAYNANKDKKGFIMPKPILNAYEFDDDLFRDPAFRTAIFNRDFDQDCIGTIAANRNVNNPDVQHLLPGFIKKHNLEDLVHNMEALRGPMAINNIKEATTKYIRGEYSAEDAIKEVRDPKFDDQIALKSPRSFDFLRHVDSVKIPF